jgi:hypothetical protein
MKRDQEKQDRKTAEIRSHNPDYELPRRISCTRKPFGLRRCRNPGCRTIWNRDVNAAINIMNVFIHERIRQDHVPNYLKPGFRARVKTNDSWRSSYERSTSTKIEVENIDVEEPENDQE